MVKFNKFIFPKHIFPVLFGEALEAYDFFLYGLLSIHFSKIFFPSDSQYSLIFSFGLFSVAYIARPIGSIVWGHIADKYGRKPVLMGTLSLMAIPAIGMAVIPSYESIGLLACILVIVLRFLQGVAFGGESPTVVVTLYEMAPKNKKGLYGSLYNPGALTGYLLGILLIITLNIFLGEKNMQDFGWRIMFGFSIIFIVVLSYIRLRLIETAPLNVNISNFPIINTIKNDLPAIFKIFLYLSCSNVMFYNLLFHNYLIIWASDFGLQSLVLQAFIVFFVILIFPLTGYLSDQMNKLSFLKIFYIFVFIVSPFLYMMFLTKSLPFMMIGYVFLAIFVTFGCGTSPAVILPQVSKNCRVTTIGLGCGLSVIFGSFIPAINEILKQSVDLSWSPALLISLCALISLVTIYTFKNKKEIQ